jgi:hypothetical protein
VFTPVGRGKPSGKVSGRNVPYSGSAGSVLSTSRDVFLIFSSYH